jgi:diamine N-acetyltransferase
VLIGDRVRLRAPERSDLPSFLRWVNDPEVTEHLLVYLPFSMEDEERWYDSLLTREGKVFTIETKEGRVIGNMGILHLEWKDRRVEMGIMIGEKDCWGKGYGTESINLLLQYLFDELNMNRVSLYADSRNTRAIRCYEKCGFKREGLLRQARFKNGCYSNDVTMAILQEDWKRLHPSPRDSDP